MVELDVRSQPAHLGREVGYGIQGPGPDWAMVNIISKGNLSSRTCGLWGYCGNHRNLLTAQSGVMRFHIVGKRWSTNPGGDSFANPLLPRRWENLSKSALRPSEQRGSSWPLDTSVTDAANPSGYPQVQANDYGPHPGAREESPFWAAAQTVADLSGFS